MEQRQGSPLDDEPGHGAASGLVHCRPVISVKGAYTARKLIPKTQRCVASCSAACAATQPETSLGLSESELLLFSVRQNARKGVKFNLGHGTAHLSRQVERSASEDGWPE